MELSLKEKLSLSLAKLQAGVLKLKHFKAYRLQVSESEFDEFCKCAADIFDGCNLLEDVKDACAGEFEQ